MARADRPRVLIIGFALAANGATSGSGLSTCRARASARRSAFSSATWLASPACAERSSPAEVAAVLNAYWGTAAPLLAGFGGEVEKFIGDGIVATFNSREISPIRASGRARRSPCSASWRFSPTSTPGLAAPAHRREQRRGGRPRGRRRGHVATPGRRHRQHGLAPGRSPLGRRRAHRRADPGRAARTLVEARTGLRMKGKEDLVNAYVLLALP